MTEDQATVATYFDALSAHDLDRAAARLADDFEMRFEAGGFVMDKPAMLAALGWDVGANGSFAYQFAAGDGETVRARIVERNEFLELIGLEPLEADMTFAVRDGKITRGTYAAAGASADPGAVSAALAPAVAWARAHRPDELEAIYPDGSIRYSRQSAERWVALLKDWRAAPDR